MITLCVKIRVITLFSITFKYIKILHLAILFWSLDRNNLNRLNPDLSLFYDDEDKDSYVSFVK